MNVLAKLEIQRNRLSRADWVRYAGQRAKVTGRLLEAARATGGGTLCVLGAGNCNDLDLRQLAAAFTAIHLVDLDGEALRAGVERQIEAGEVAAISLHPSVDLGDVAATLAPWSLDRPPQPAEMAAIVERLSARPWLVLEQQSVDVIASTCVLSQLVDAAVRTIGDWHPRFFDIVRAIRQSHWRLMVGQLRDGGCGLLFTDFVSSDTCPELLHTAEESLLALIARLIAERNFFTGLNPLAMCAALAEDAELQGRVSELRLLPPWTWQQAARTYAVTVLEFRRAAVPVAAAVAASD